MLHCWVGGLEGIPPSASVGGRLVFSQHGLNAATLAGGAIKNSFLSSCCGGVPPPPPPAPPLPPRADLTAAAICESTQNIPVRALLPDKDTKVWLPQKGIVQKKTGLEIFTKEIAAEGVSGDVEVKGETVFGLTLRINFKSFYRNRFKVA